MRVIGAMAAAAFALAGCVSPEVIASQQAAADNQECISLGFRPGTDGYGNCRLQLRQIRTMQEMRDAAWSAASTPAWPSAWPYWDRPFRRPWPRR